MKCRYCDGDTDDPGHDQRCDGHQGALDWDAEDGPPPATTIASPRDTSVQAFYNAVDSGKIRTRRQQVYAALSVLAEATASEVFEYLKAQRHFHGGAWSPAGSRFSELRDMGLIRETGQRPCRVTRQMCITWAVVPAAEYVGQASIRRCPACGQVVSRDVPVSVEEGHAPG